MVSPQKSLFSRLRDRLRLAEPEPEQAGPKKVVIVHDQPVGSFGTEIYHGYPSEEYLATLRGTDAADVWDKMRRSDPQIKMITNAIKNPIKSATWEVLPGGDSDEAEKQAELIKQILFHDMDVPWSRFLGEALTLVEFGYSLFEEIHKTVLNHPQFGSYIGLKALAYRSQRTIERFNVNRDTGTLLTVSQYAYGDLQKLVDIPAQFLVHFALDQEGANYEGISALRACYGSYIRKNMYMKLNAIGIEKFAVPTPVLEVPDQQQNATQFANAKAALEAYTSHQSNYITYPVGWKLELKSNVYDPEKVEKSIDAEDKRMVKSLLAGFLELGLSGHGTQALSSDLSDFFLFGLQHIADIVCDGLNRKTIKNLVDLNYGPQPVYPMLKCSGISDKAGKELAETLKYLSDGKYITPDDPLEVHLRKRLGLTEMSDQGKRISAAPQPPNEPEQKPSNGNLGLSDRRFRLAEITARKQIADGKAEVKDVMQKHLKNISKAMAGQIIAEYKKLPDSKRMDAIKAISFPGRIDYSRELLESLSVIAIDALDKARREVPKKRNIRLSEFDNLPPDLKKKVKAQSDLLVDTQLEDLKKNMAFQFTSSVDSTDSDDILYNDMVQSGEDFRTGASIEAGSGNAAAFAVNAARSAFFFDEEVLPEIASFTFVNGDPVSPICQDLAGTTFAVDDPEAQRYFPPLHHNCKSYIVPNLVGGTDKPLTDGGLRPSKAELEKYITLSEAECCGKS